MAFQTGETFPATASFPTGSSFPSASSFPSTYDPDADLYFTATGITDQTQKLNISQWITGLKKNNVWNQMTEGWSFRSTQNVGSGTSALGMRGVWTGTLTNSPTWGVDGITLGANKHILVTNFFNARPNEFSALTVSTPNANGTRVAVSTGNGMQLISYISQTIVNNACTPTISTGISNGASRACCYWSMAPARYQVAINGGAKTSTAITAYAPFTGANLRISGVDGGGVEPTDITALFWFTRVLTDTEWGNLYTLYKTTIGQGLGLP